MRIKFDLAGPYRDVAPLLEAYPDTAQRLCERCASDMEVPFETLPVRALIELAEGRVPKEVEERYGGGTLERWCEAVNGYRRKMLGFVEFMRRTTPPMSPRAREASGGLLELTMEEGVLVSLTQFYGLHSLEDAQKLTIAEYMIMRKTQYNEKRMAYNVEMAAAARANRRGRGV